MTSWLTTSRGERRRGSATEGRHGSPVIASGDSLRRLLSNKPVELPDPNHLLGRQSAAFESEHWSSSTHSIAPVVTRPRISVSERTFVSRVALSAPLLSIAKPKQVVPVPSHLPLPHKLVSCCDVEDGQAIVRRTLKRVASFGGRPQPLPLPVEDVPTKQLQAPATRPFKSEAGNITGRGGERVAAVTEGIPLPPPSLASKLLRPSPSLAAFEFRQLVLATDDFAASRCLLKSASGDVFRARVEDSSGATIPPATVDVAVLRLPKSTLLGATEWKSDVHLLAQISHRNVCAVKGYCTHEAAGSRFNPRARRRLERLLVFAQPSNGSLHDHLFGSRTSLNWTTRVNIALGAARGLLYIHDHGPLEIAFKEFTASTVLLENDFAPKLAGYGLSVMVPLVHRSSSFATGIMLSQAQAKVNVRSFGVLLLELVTGKNSRDAMYFGDDANFVRWGRECMTDGESRPEQIIDPRMNGGCPMERAMEVVRLSLRCVSKREAQRPSLSEVVGTLKTIKAKQHQCSDKPRVEASRNPEGLRPLVTNVQLPSSGGVSKPRSTIEGKGPEGNGPPGRRDDTPRQGPGRTGGWFKASRLK